MIDRRTFLKLSAGALVLTAAGALTGCGGMNDRPKVTIDGVVFMCEAPVITGGSGYVMRYCPLFAIQNDTGERVILEPEDITGTFTDMENNMYPLEFVCKKLTVEPHSYEEYGNSLKFCLESENRVPAEYSKGRCRPHPHRRRCARERVKGAQGQPGWEFPREIRGFQLPPYCLRQQGPTLGSFAGETPGRTDPATGWGQ